LAVAGHRQEFQRELEAIEAKVIELFAMVAEDLPGATHALLTGDNEVVRVLTERGKTIDALYPEIEELVNRGLRGPCPASPPGGSGSPDGRRHGLGDRCSQLGGTPLE
jgi:hypothetical protein